MFKKVTLIFAIFCLLALRVLAANDRFTLVIDAGHGGHDAGALGSISKEKNINLAVALRFGKYVEQNLPDVRVMYTRKTDVFIPLHERANIANRANADLFISVHTNALPAGKIARGFETYTLGMHRAKDNLDVAMRENSVISMEKGYQQTYQGFDPKSSESYIIFEFIQGKNMERSVELARMIQRSVCDNANRPDKGVHQAGFLVLRETSMPSCLIELGFITTPDEENLLNDDARIDDIAKGIYEAFAKYKNKYDKRVAVPYRALDNEETQVPRIVPDTYRQKERREAVSSDTTSRSASASQGMSTTRSASNARNVSASRSGQRGTSNDAEKDNRNHDLAVTKASDKRTSRLQDMKAAKMSDAKSSRPTDVKKSMSSDAKSLKLSSVKDAPVFKLQIFVSNRLLRKGDSHFKGETGYDSYQEGGMVKYTMGASTNYNEVYRLRKDLADKFPEAFIIAFKNGKKFDVNQAIREFKQNKNR